MFIEKCERATIEIEAGIGKPNMHVPGWRYGQLAVVGVKASDQLPLLWCIVDIEQMIYCLGAASFFQCEDACECIVTIVDRKLFKRVGTMADWAVLVAIVKSCNGAMMMIETPQDAKAWLAAAKAKAAST